MTASIKIDAFIRALGQHAAAAMTVALLVGGPALVDALRDGVGPAGVFVPAAVDALVSGPPGLDRGMALWMR
ncbi:MAG: hypothetical protein AAGI51_11935 [Pseudomonadota bacterium]